MRKALALIIGFLLYTTIPYSAHVSAQQKSDDLVFVGTVTEIYPAASSRPSRHQWAIVTRVDRVKSGEFLGATFSFTVHSPALSGLSLNHSYIIKATKTDKGYVVKDLSFEEVPGKLTETKDIKLEVGSMLPAKYIPKNNRAQYMTHSAQFRPYIMSEIVGVTFIIAYDEKSNVIKYISTFDKQFKSSDGFRVGDYIEVKDDQVTAFPGWEIRGPKDKNGWQPLIGFNSEMIVHKSGHDLKIELKQYHLPSQQPVNAKITGFVKGGN